MINPVDFLKILKERRTIRSFQDKMLSDKEIEMILEAGRWAPSASNRQAWEFIVVKSKEVINKLAKSAIYGKFVREAPIVVAIIGDVHENPNWYVQDTTLASMNMMLMAWALNIGTCWIGSMDREKAKEILGIKKDKFLLTILPFGYVQGDIPKPPYRKDLNEITKEIN
jgi:nitroreductase